MKSEFCNSLYKKTFEYLNMELTDTILYKLETYKNMLLKWNENINLTAITNEDDIIIKHFVDSLECVRYIKKEQSVIDVGTGAGFPGLVVAIYFENKINLTLLDALNKRIIFLQEVVNELNIKNVEIIHSRAEELGKNERYREKYDIVLARAVANLPVLLEYTSPFAKINGKCILMKGDNVLNEINVSKKSLNVLNCKINDIYSYNLVATNDEYKRNIIEIEKIDKTPQKYPRNYGQMLKHPL